MLSEKTSAGIQSIEIGVPLLRALAEARTPLTLSALAGAVGMPPSKAHKYLASFIRCGLVTQAESGGRYDLGPFALDLGLSAMRRIDIMEIAQPAMDDLRDLVGTTVSMAVWANRGATIVRIADTPGIMSLTIRIGTVMPLLTSSFGRCFAAFLPRAMTQAIMQAEIGTPDGVRSQAEADRLLEGFRAQGFASAVDLVDPGRAAICAPIFDMNGRMVAGLAVIGVQDRLDVSSGGKIAQALLAATRALSRRLGAPQDDKTGDEKPGRKKP